MRVQVQLRDGPSSRNTLPYTCSDNRCSRLTLQTSFTCSQHSESENATESDLPGPGRIVGKLFNQLGYSVEALVAKRKFNRLARSRTRSADYIRASLENDSAESPSTDSFTSSDAESHSPVSRVQDVDSHTRHVTSGSCHQTWPVEENGSASHDSAPPPTSDRFRLSPLPNTSPAETSILTTCSLSRSLSTNATLSDLTGSGRLLGKGYSALGKIVEKGINKAFSWRSPDAVSRRLESVLRKLIRWDFLLEYEDVEKAEMKDMEGILGIRDPSVLGVKGRKRRGALKSKSQPGLQLAVRNLIDQSCDALLRHASNYALHEMQIRALINILELSAAYPIARGCLNSLGARERIFNLTLDTVLPIGVSMENGRCKWPEGHSRAILDASETLSLLRARCVVALGTNGVYDAWRDFFLAGGDFEREKSILRLLTYFRNKELTFLAARVLTSILRRPRSVASEEYDPSETAWSEIFVTLVQCLTAEHNRHVRSARAFSGAGIEPDVLDCLLHVALERASLRLGKFSRDFMDDSSPFMGVVQILTGSAYSSSRYPIAIQFALMLVPVRNRERMRRATT